MEDRMIKAWKGGEEHEGEMAWCRAGGKGVEVEEETGQVQLHLHEGWRERERERETQTHMLHP